MINCMYVQCSANGCESWPCHSLSVVIWSELHYKWELSVLIWKVGVQRWIITGDEVCENVWSMEQNRQLHCPLPPPRVTNEDSCAEQGPDRDPEEGE